MHVTVRNDADRLKASSSSQETVEVAQHAGRGTPDEALGPSVPIGNGQPLTSHALPVQAVMAVDALPQVYLTMW